MSIVVLATIGALLAMVLANVLLGQTAFRVSELERTIAERSQQLDDIQLEVESLRSPSRIARRARELGMVRGSTPTVIAPGTTSDVRGLPPVTGRP